LEAILDRGEDGYEEGSCTRDDGVAEREDGAEDDLQESTDAKERAETELIWEDEGDGGSRQMSTWLFSGWEKGLHSLIHCHVCVNWMEISIPKMLTEYMYPES
jgi:hypothetical protein